MVVAVDGVDGLLRGPLRLPRPLARVLPRALAALDGVNAPHCARVATVDV